MWRSGREQGAEWGGGGRRGQDTHQQLLRDQLHDEFLWPLLRVPVGTRVRGANHSPRPHLAPGPMSHLQVLPRVHIGLAGQDPLQLGTGV